MTLNLKKKVTLTASQMLAENNRATADRLTWAAQTDEMNLRTALNVPENGLTEERRKKPATATAAMCCRRASARRCTSVSPPRSSIRSPSCWCCWRFSAH